MATDKRFLIKFRLKRKFIDISVNFREAYSPNPHGENSGEDALIWKICCQFSSELSFGSPSFFEERSKAVIEI